jgi:hypothetical protein
MTLRSIKLSSTANTCGFSSKSNSIDGKEEEELAISTFKEHTTMSNHFNKTQKEKETLRKKERKLASKKIMSKGEQTRQEEKQGSKGNVM